jgi:hypothetical protein
MSPNFWKLQAEPEKLLTPGPGVRPGHFACRPLSDETVPRSARIGAQFLARNRMRATYRLRAAPATRYRLFISDIPIAPERS